MFAALESPGKTQRKRTHMKTHSGRFFLETPLKTPDSILWLCCVVLTLQLSSEGVLPVAMDLMTVNVKTHV